VCSSDLIIAGVGFIGGGLLLVGNAFIFALIPSLIIVALARFKRATPETMILAGIAMTYIFSAVSSLLHYFSEAEALQETAKRLGMHVRRNIIVVMMVASFLTAVIICVTRMI